MFTFEGSMYIKLREDFFSSKNEDLLVLNVWGCTGIYCLGWHTLYIISQRKKSSRLFLQEKRGGGSGITLGKPEWFQNQSATFKTSCLGFDPGI